MRTSAGPVSGLDWLTGQPLVEVTAPGAPRAAGARQRGQAPAGPGLPGVAETYGCNPGSPTRSTWPVRPWPCSLSRYAMTSATWLGAHGLSISSDTALTVMSRSCSSSASDRVSTSVAALVAAYRPWVLSDEPPAELDR